MVNTAQPAKRALGRAFATLALFAAAPFVHGQASGFNFSLGYANSFKVNDDHVHDPKSVIGLSYQQDLDHRFGVALDFFYGSNGYGTAYERSYDLIYSAKYFTSDNDDATSFYLGTFFGLQHMNATVEELVPNGSGNSTYIQSDHTKIQFPLGIRAGVRGGLDGFFGELFAQVGYAIGNGTIYHTSDGVTVATNPLYFTVGVSFLGVGWDHRPQ